MTKKNKQLILIVIGAAVMVLSWVLFFKGKGKPLVQAFTPSKTAKPFSLG